MCTETVSCYKSITKTLLYLNIKQCTTNKHEKIKNSFFQNPLVTPLTLHLPKYHFAAEQRTTH